MEASAKSYENLSQTPGYAVKGRLIAEKRYEIGNGTILELNNSEVSLTQARLTYGQSIFDYLSAKADLDKKDIEFLRDFKLQLKEQSRQGTEKEKND